MDRSMGAGGAAMRWIIGIGFLLVCTIIVFIEAACAMDYNPDWDVQLWEDEDNDDGG